MPGKGKVIEIDIPVSNVLTAKGQSHESAPKAAPSASQSQPASSVAAEARLRIQYSCLPRRSHEKLIETLEGWLRWHHKQTAMPIASAERLLSGSLEYSAVDFATAGVWVDRPSTEAELAAADGRTFNLQYELDGGVPLYDRALDAPLSDTAALSPDGTITRNVSLGRSRGSQRCFNCGSYNHDMSACPQPRDAEAISAGLASMRAARLVDGERPASRRLHDAWEAPHVHRYFLAGGGGGVGGSGPDEDAEGAAPGHLSPELREALRIGPLDPPPWLQKMRQLGLPPEYKGGGASAASPTPVSQKHDGADELFVVFDDADAESLWHSGGLKRKAAAAKPSAKRLAPAAVDGRTAAAATDFTASSAQDGADSSLGQQMRPAAVPADAATEGGEQQQPDEPAGIPGLESLGDHLVLGNVVGMPADEQSGAASLTATVPGTGLSAVAFPGVNAPIPEGADPARWGAMGNGAPNGLHGTVHGQPAAAAGSQAAHSRGVKRSFETANGFHAGVAGQRTYDESGHSGANLQRQRYHYHVRNPDPLAAPPSAHVASPPTPSLFSNKLAPMPQRQSQPQPHNAFAIAPAAQVYHHYTSYAAGQASPPLPPPGASYPQHMHQQQPSYPEHSYAQPSYAQPSAPGMPALGTAAGAFWQPAQWPSPQAYPMYRIRQ